MTNIKKLEAELWESADLLRQGSKLTSSQYCMPVLALLFLRYAYSRFKIVFERLAIDNPSEKNLSGYLIANNKFPSEVSVERILYAVREVGGICTLGSNITYQDDNLLYKHCEGFKGTVRRIKSSIYLL